MNRQVLAVVVASLFTVPAFAGKEFNAGNLPQPAASRKDAGQVRAELVQAQHAGKLRREVRGELEQKYRSGKVILNAALGITANRL